jgi:hypothetical protein
VTVNHVILSDQGRLPRSIDVPQHLPMARFDHEVAHKVAHEIQRMRQIRALRQARRQALGQGSVDSMEIH